MCVRNRHQAKTGKLLLNFALTMIGCSYWHASEGVGIWERWRYPC